MSKLSKVLSVLLAMVLLFSTASVGVEAAYNAYKDGAITRYDSIDKPVLTPDQYASMAMDEVDRMLGEANLKIEYDLAGMMTISADFTSVDKALVSIADACNTIKGALSTIGGDIAQINFSALVNMNTNPATLVCPKRTTAGKTDADILIALLKFLKDNSAIIAKVPKGSAANGGLDLGPILSNFIDLGDKLNVPKLVKELLGKYVYPQTPKNELDTTKSLDVMVKDFIDEVASGEYATYADGIKALKEGSKLVAKYLPGFTDQVDLLNDSVYDILDKGIKIMLNAVAIPYANPRVKALLNRLCGYDYYKTKDEDGDTIWKRVEENPKDDINAMINVINTNFNLDPFPVEEWGDDWVFDHLNDILGHVVREAIKEEIAIDWDYSRGNDALMDNIISVAKTVLKNTGDALFANYIEVLTPEQIDAMEDEPFIAYVLRSILNASISFVYITNDCDTVLDVLFELVKQIAADFVPWRNYANLDADIDGIMAMGLDMAVYGLNGITNMDLDYGLDVDDFADAAMDWVIENYGGFVEDVEGNNGWEKLSYVIFNIIPSNWLSTKADGSERDNLYDILMDDIVGNILNYDLASVLKLVDKNPDGELNNTIIEVVLARLTGVINYVLPGVFPTEADYSELENLLDPDLLSQIIENLLDSLYDRAQNGLLDSLLPVVCMALGLSSPETFGYPYISLEDEHTASSAALDSFYMYNGSSGINTNATDKYGNTPAIPDKLYTYRVKSITTNNGSVHVSPSSNITINGGTATTFALSGVADAEGSVLKITITYDVLSEKGTVMTPNPLTATTYTYIHSPSIVEDDEKAKADADDKNTHLVYYKPTTYLSKGSKLSELADYTMDMQRNKWKDSTLHNNDATFSINNATIDSGLTALGVSANTPFSVSTNWKGGVTEYSPYKVADKDTVIPEGSYTNSFFFNATKTEGVAENISFTHNIFVYDDFGLGSLLKSAVNADRQKANYGTGNYTAEYVDFYADPEDEEPETVTESVNGSAAWDRYVEAVDAAAAIVYAPRQVSTMQTFVDNGDFEMAAYELYCAAKELDACSISGGTAGIKSALDAIVAPDTFINEYGEEETYDYDDARHTYFGREDYVNYTYSNFKRERRAAERALDAEKEAIKKGETYQIEAIRAAYLAHRVTLYGERLVRVRAYKTYLQEAITKYTPLYNAGQGTYSNKTWNDFERAINFANAVNAKNVGSTISGTENLANDNDLRQSMVNEARAQLVKAAKRLAEAVPTVNYEQINALIETVKPTFQAGNAEPTYTELSWNTFVSAYREAVEIVEDELEDTPANQTKVNDAYEALNAAFNGLEKVSSGDEGNWGFDESSEIFVSPSQFLAIEYVTGLYDWWINVSSFVSSEGATSVEVILNDYGMESTGAVLVVEENGVTTEYPIVFYSDINGDGVCDPTDYTELVDAQGYAGLTDWEYFALTDENPQAMAADLNHDCVLDGTDNTIMADIQGFSITYYQHWEPGDEAFDYI